MIHIVKGFSIVNEAEVDVFLELSCFFYDSTDVGKYTTTVYIRYSYLKKKTGEFPGGRDGRQEPYWRILKSKQNIMRVQRKENK